MYMRKLVGAMHEKGLSQKEAAEFIGISEPSFRKYIKTGGFDINHIKALSNKLGLESAQEIYDIFLS